MTYAAFKTTIYNFYRKNRRDFPWRHNASRVVSPYEVVVSEIMLQQTQASRVIAKFESFIKKFPNFEALAAASLKEVLTEWQGLGYNRRGLNLQRLAQIITSHHKGNVPRRAEELIELPGIGPGTVGSLLAFVHNIPHPFIETNIRTVFIHFFFKNKKGITDTMILPLVEKTLDKKNPREWYYALMDYGVMLKKHHVNPSRKSLHYKKQSKFKGSNRELRSLMLKYILQNPGVTDRHIKTALKHPRLQSFDENITALIKEGLIRREKNQLHVND